LDTEIQELTVQTHGIGGLNDGIAVLELCRIAKCCPLGG
jgi:uridine phosphorylase